MDKMAKKVKTKTPKGAKGGKDEGVELKRGMASQKRGSHEKIITLEAKLREVTEALQK